MVENRGSDRGFVVVTGTSTGIGAATARRLANKGFHVFAGVRREADAEAARSVANGAVTPLMIDITDPAMIDAAAKTVVAPLASTAGLGSTTTPASSSLGRSSSSRSTTSAASSRSTRSVPCP
ncbi:MAG: SDR family NAD(P)-dependent oxidoreductase [Solirubrobacteraceae bacterium]